MVQIAVSVIYVSRCTYKHQSHIRSHCHNFYHLLYMVGGSGRLRLDGIEHRPAENDIYMIPPWVNHEIVSDCSSPLKTIEVKFIVEDERLFGLMKRLPPVLPGQPLDVRLMLEAMLKEAEGRKPFFKEIVGASFLRLLFCILRMNGADARAEGAAFGSDDLAVAALKDEQASEERDLPEKVLQYLNANFDKKIALRDLSRMFGFHHTHLSKLFSKKYGISPIQHLNRYRMQKVKELLSSTDLTITEISERTGFRSVHYLSRYFASKERISPIGYRQKARESVYWHVEDRYEIVGSMARPSVIR